MSGKPFFVVIAYDVVDDSRRNRLAQTLLDFGVRVQYSVFEAIIDRKNIERMVRKVRRIIKRNEDSVRIYVLTKTTKKEIIKIGVQPETEVSEVDDVLII